MFLIWLQCLKMLNENQNFKKDMSDSKEAKTDVKEQTRDPTRQSTSYVDNICFFKHQKISNTEQHFTISLLFIFIL